MPRRTFILVALVAAGIVVPTWTAPLPVKKPVKEITNSIGMKLVLIPAGKFRMGSPTDEKDRGDDEHLHAVEITKAFFMGAYPVTQGEYEKVVGSNPSHFSANGGGKDKVKGVDTSKFPVEAVNWYEAVEFCEKLTALAKEKEEGREYRLPTEAEWEYACRAGTKTRFSTCDDEDSVKEAAWYSANSDGRTHMAGTKKGNAWGLYDMHGNVFQWCSDGYTNDYYKKSAKRDPKGPETRDSRVRRGGSWYNDAGVGRAACRHCNAPSTRKIIDGFRVVCVPSGK